MRSPSLLSQVLSQPQVPCPFWHTSVTGPQVPSQPLVRCPFQGSNPFSGPRPLLSIWFYVLSGWYPKPIIWGYPSPHHRVPSLSPQVPSQHLVPCPFEDSTPVLNIASNILKNCEICIV